MKTSHILWIVLFLYTKVSAQVDPIDKNNLAIGGYDLVSYFNVGKAIKGLPANASVYQGVTYQFINEENQKLFESDPAHFLPQYAGYCALAVSYGKKVSINPEAFKITNGKLYLFFYGKSGTRTVNSLDTWIKSEPRLLKKADELWPKVTALKYKTGEGL